MHPCYKFQGILIISWAMFSNVGKYVIISMLHAPIFNEKNKTWICFANTEGNTEVDS